MAQRQQRAPPALPAGERSGACSLCDCVLLYVCLSLCISVSVYPLCGLWLIDSLHAARSASDQASDRTS
ncbi:hypothetical protein B484DRAFT_447509 [Ochromonadaceae sp. CCMP2298]|nr:hypothetical protein B484DRAFT_447509 [Ochromonadaceae sp. CCMP2298]